MGQVTFCPPYNITPLQICVLTWTYGNNILMLTFQLLFQLWEQSWFFFITDMIIMLSVCILNITFLQCHVNRFICYCVCTHFQKHSDHLFSVSTIVKMFECCFKSFCKDRSIFVTKLFYTDIIFASWNDVRFCFVGIFTIMWQKVDGQTLSFVVAGIRAVELFAKSLCPSSEPTASIIFPLWITTLQLGQCILRIFMSHTHFWMDFYPRMPCITVIIWNLWLKRESSYVL